MKKCKSCQSEIDSRAKKCPNCGKRQGLPIWLIIIIAIIMICVFVSGGNDEPKSTNNNSNSSGKKAEEKTKTSFETNETVTYKDVEYRIENVERSSGSEFDKPEDGKEFLIITINIKNNSSEKVSYNALDWKLTNSSGQENSETFTTNNNNALNSGDLAKGGVVTGTLAYEIPEGDSGLKFSYYDNMLDDEEAFYFNIK